METRDLGRLEAGAAGGGARPWLALVAICVGFFTVLLDTTIVNIAIPSIIRGLGSSLDQVLWVVNAYLLVYAVLLIPAGRLGDVYGPRRVALAGLAVFTAASAACGLAQDPGQLIAARCLQGVGGALLTPNTLALILGIFPPERRGPAVGIWAGVNALAALAGPTLGGWIITTWDWRWIFSINVPVGIAAIAGSLLFVPEIRAGRRRGLDPVGALLIGAGLLAVVFGLLEGERYHWGQVTGWLSIPAILGAGVALLLVFAAWELRQADGLLPVRAFRDRNYSLAGVLVLVVAFGMIGVMLPLVIYFQSVLGLSALDTGLSLSPIFLGLLVAAPLSGRLTDLVPGKYLLLVGFTVAAAGFVLVGGTVGAHASGRDFLAPMLVLGGGMGFVTAPLFAVATAGVPQEIAGAASGFITALRQVGATLGTAAMGAILQNRLAVALHEEAAQRASTLPAPLRGRFVDAMSGAVHSSDVARGGVAELPAGVPPELASQVTALAHEVFAQAFVAAMRPSLLIGVAVLAVGGVIALLMSGRRAARRALDLAA